MQDALSQETGFEQEIVEEEEEVEVEVEEVEMQKREVEKEVVEEKLIPRVKTLYRHHGQGMGFEKGEVGSLHFRHTKTVTCVCTCRCSYWFRKPTKIGG